MTDAAAIAAQIREQYPSVVAVHLGGEAPDFVGTWYFKFEGRYGETVLESPTGSYPFFIRSDDEEPSNACEVISHEEAVEVLGKYLDDLLNRRRAPFTSLFSLFHHATDR